MQYLTTNKKKPAQGKAPSGFVMYDGPSAIDGAPIVVIATLKSSNRKTGDMVQYRTGSRASVPLIQKGKLPRIY